MAESDGPELIAYSFVQASPGGKRFWNKLGAVFPNKGRGSTLVLDSIPFDQWIELRNPSEPLEAGDNNSPSNTTVLIAYSVLEKGQRKKAYWHKVGAVFLNNGKGYTLFLYSIPLSRRIQLLKPSEQPQADEDGPPQES